jgi:hypothetical protein
MVKSQVPLGKKAQVLVSHPKMRVVSTDIGTAYQFSFKKL